MYKKLLLIAFFALYIGITGIPWLNPLDDKKNKLPIRISISPNTGFELLHLADMKGFFKDEAVSVKLVRLSTMEDARRTYVRGQVDGMTGTLSELITAKKNGRESRILMALDASEGTDIIIARKGINSLAELKGKKIAMEPESYGLSLLDAGLEKVNLSHGDVNIKGMNQLNIPHAISNGDIDAAHSYAPYSIPLLKNNPNISVLIDSSETVDEIIGVIALDPKVIMQRPEDMKAIKRAWDRAVIYAQSHPEEANMLMSEIDNISQQEFANEIQKIRIFKSDDNNILTGPSGILEKCMARINSIRQHETPEAEPISLSDYTLPDNYIIPNK